MAIDNLNLLKQFLVFDNLEDDYYVLQTIQRRKEHPDLKINNRVVDTVYLYDGDLERKYERIKERATYFNARVYLRLNRRSAEATAKHCLVKIAQMIEQNNYKSIKDAYASASGERHSDKNKKWLLDIDKDTLADKDRIVERLSDLPTKSGKVLAEIPTVNGLHLITTVFDVQAYKNRCISECFQQGTLLDIHKDNPTLLYYNANKIL